MERFSVEIFEIAAFGLATFAQMPSERERFANRCLESYLGPLTPTAWEELLPRSSVQSVHPTP
jgi:hypothetical protein